MLDVDAEHQDDDFDAKQNVHASQDASAGAFGRPVTFTEMCVLKRCPEFARFTVVIFVRMGRSDIAVTFPLLIRAPVDISLIGSFCSLFVL